MKKYKEEEAGGGKYLLNSKCLMLPLSAQQQIQLDVHLFKHLVGIQTI